MTAVAPHLDWEENTERRLGIVEQKVDKILDPETGIYPKISQLEGHLVKWAIGILTSLLLLAALVIVQLVTGVHH